MTEKNDITKEDGSLEVVEAELMDSENMSTRDTQLTTRESVPPTAYTLGKAAAWLGSFLLGLVKGMKARNDHTGGDGRSRVGGGKRARKNRRRYRS